MRKLFLYFRMTTALIFLCTFYGLSVAQIPEPDSTVTIDNLRTPASPVFTLLDIAPTSVEKPETPKALASHILNTLEQKTAIPRDFALEFAPYWLVSRPNVSFNDFYKPKGGQVFIQNLTFSVATKRIETQEDTSSIVGVGFRSLLVAGKPNPKLEKIYKNFNSQREVARADLQEFLEQRQAKNLIVESLLVPLELQQYPNIDALIDGFKQSIETLKKDTTRIGGLNINLDEVQDGILKLLRKKKAATKEEVENLLKIIIMQVENANSAKLKKEALAFQKENKKRVGFVLALAGAVAWRFPQDSVKNGEFSRIGVWLTPTFSGEKLDLITVLRYIRDHQAKKNYEDLGLRLLYKTGAFGISIEGIYRIRSGDDTRRYSLNLEFKFADGIFMTGSYGRDFEGNRFGGKGDLITLLGLNIGFGSKVNL